ncbi:MAG: methyltransferase domain-containing protein [Methanomicrobia archaeon]|nr:methyltransferase domain-containing protein [Methanomicrobia archaeon]
MKNFYEQKEVWEKYREDIEKRVETYYREAISLIPADVESVLDAGCGEGTFLSLLHHGYRLVGLDASITALRYAKAAMVWGSLDNLPLKSNSFDLVTTLETLEHLKQDTFFDALAELKRVARKYIIVSVPNDEPLEYYLVVCPSCGCHFNAVGHVRSFSRDSLEKLFYPEFSLQTIIETGDIVEYPTYNKVIFVALRSYIKPKPPRDAICPQCGYRMDEEKDRISYSEMPVSLRVLKRVTDFIWRPKKRVYHFLALYEK